eukprot:UN04429
MDDLQCDGNDHGNIYQLGPTLKVCGDNSGRTDETDEENTNEVDIIQYAILMVCTLLACVFLNCGVRLCYHYRARKQEEVIQMTEYVQKEVIQITDFQK